MWAAIFRTEFQEKSIRTIDFRTTLIAAVLAAVISGPGFAVTKCPTNGQHFSFKGSVKGIGTTKDGQTYYDVSNAHCGDTEHDTIAVYPPSPCRTVSRERPVVVFSGIRLGTASPLSHFGRSEDEIRQAMKHSRKAMPWSGQLGNELRYRSVKYSN